MLISELSSYVLEIPNDAYTTLSQNLISCSTHSQEYCKLTLENNEKAILSVNMPDEMPQSEALVICTRNFCCDHGQSQLSGFLIFGLDIMILDNYSPGFG